MSKNVFHVAGHAVRNCLSYLVPSEIKERSSSETCLCFACVYKMETLKNRKRTGEKNKKTDAERYIIKNSFCPWT